MGLSMDIPLTEGAVLPTQPVRRAWTSAARLHKGLGPRPQICSQSHCRARCACRGDGLLGGQQRDPPVFSEIFRHSGRRQMAHPMPTSSVSELPKCMQASGAFQFVASASVEPDRRKSEGCPERAIQFCRTAPDWTQDHPVQSSTIPNSAPRGPI